MNERRKTGLYVSCSYTDASNKQLKQWCEDSGIVDPIESRHYHTTVLYSRTNVGDHEGVILDLTEELSNTIDEPITSHVEFKSVGFKLFDSKMSTDRASLVIEFEAPLLVKIHQKLISLGGTHDYPDYTPHLTLSYRASKSLDLSTLKLPEFSMIVKKFKAEPLDVNWNK